MAISCPRGQTPVWTWKPGHDRPVQTCAVPGTADYANVGKSRTQVLQEGRAAAGIDEGNVNVHPEGAVINPRTGLPDRSPTTPTRPTHRGEPCPPGQYRPSNREPCRPMPHDPEVSDREVVCRNRGWEWVNGRCLEPCPEGQIRGNDGKCASTELPAGCAKVMRQNAVAMAECEKAGGTWKRQGDCKPGKCEGVDDGDDGDGDPSGGGDPGGGGGTGGDGTGLRQPVPNCPPGQARVWKDGIRGGQIICQPIKGLPQDPVGQQVPCEQPGFIRDADGNCVDTTNPAVAQAHLPQFSPQVGQVRAFKAPSIADVLRDPNYLQASADMASGIRGQAEASGIRGAPLLAALSGAKQRLMGDMYGRKVGESLAGWQANFGRGRDIHDREVGAWGRAWDPFKFSSTLGMAANQMRFDQGMGLADYDLRRQGQLSDQAYREKALMMQDALSRYGIDQGTITSIVNSVLSGL